MTEGKIRHMFPGGNTPQGFFSYYDYVIPDDATRIFLLKGGPGVGKSTFMKKVGQTLREHGYLIEHHHCSSDPNSLDGLVIPELNVALIDGTSPHIVDPKYPGCVDEILNLGGYWNESSMVSSKTAIISCTKEISKRFQRAYRLLTAAKAVYDNWEAANQEAMDYALANQKAAALLAMLFQDITTAGYGRNRKLFASAITPLGPVNYIDSITAGFTQRYMITGLPGTGKATLLAKIADAAVSKGLNIETFYCPLDPLKPEHILIPALDTAIITSTPPHNQNCATATKVLDMNECLNKEVLLRLEALTDYDRSTFWELFGKAGAQIHEAKKLHDELESYYTPNINFSGIDALRIKTLARIAGYAVS